MGMPATLGMEQCYRFNLVGDLFHIPVSVVAEQLPDDDFGAVLKSIQQIQWHVRRHMPNRSRWN